MRKLILTSVAVLSILAGGCNSAVPPTAPNAMAVEPGMSQPPAGNGVSGTWVGVGHGVRGSVRFSALNGVGRLDFSDDFSVAAVPGPFVYVNTTNNPNSGRPLRVSALRSNRGAQSYTFQLPAGASYTWILIWCDPFNTGVAETQIPATP